MAGSAAYLVHTRKKYKSIVACTPLFIITSMYITYQEVGTLYVCTQRDVLHFAACFYSHLVATLHVYSIEIPCNCSCDCLLQIKE